MSREPKVGASVHYSVETRGWGIVPRAAIITQICEDDPRKETPVHHDVGLAIFEPDTTYNIGRVPYAEEPTPGYWSWPPLD